MSDDENEATTTTTKRSSIMDTYLYGAERGGNGGDTSDDEDARKRRSKSHDSSKLLSTRFGTVSELREGQTRSRTRDIEHGVRIKYKSVHSLVESQNDRLVNEKEKLNELNVRLDSLVEAIKQKKHQNDDLETKIKSYKEQVLSAGDNSLRKQYTEDLDEAKRDLNNVSQMSSLSKIRASRSLYDLDRLRENFDAEIRQQSHTREKIKYLENQRAESLHELSFLKETCTNREAANQEEADKNERLRRQMSELSDRLDGELEQRVDLECRIQTMLEQRKFEVEINDIMREELERLFLYHGRNKLFDPQQFYNTELNQIKERIRDDFNKLNEFNTQNLRAEYEFKYTKTVEEIETIRQAAEAQRMAAENEELMNIKNLKQEHLENEEELKNLRLSGFRLSQTLEELKKKMGDYQSRLEMERSRRDDEIAELIERINNLKIEMSTMLNFSKTLDAEVSVYARLLNERFTQFEGNDDDYLDEESSTKFSYEKYKETIFGNTMDDEAEARRRKEQEELRKKQIELEQHQKRLRELEIERDRERERVRRAREAELDEQARQQRLFREQEEIRRQREIEENNRIQREHEEKQRRQKELDEIRIQREHEETQRRQEEVRKQREIEEYTRIQREHEEVQRRQREQEEARKQREIEEYSRVQREHEETQRRQREFEDTQRRQKELDELRIQREQEEVRKQREIEEFTRIQHEENQRRQRELEEIRRREIEEYSRIQHEETVRRQKEFEEYTRIQREHEESQRRQRELEETQLKKQREIEERKEQEERQRRQRELEEQKRLRELERRQFELELEKKRIWELEQKRLKEIEEQRVLREQEEQLRVKQIEEEEYELEQRRLKEEDERRRLHQFELQEQQRREREMELRRLEDIIVHEQQRKIHEAEEKRRLQLEEEERERQRRLQEADYQLKLVEQQRRQQELEELRIREIEETTIINKRRQHEQEQQRRVKEQEEQLRRQRDHEIKLLEQERQRRLEQEREEREKYILEKLKQEQELIEIQRRQKLVERDDYEHEYRQYQHKQQQQVKCVDNVSLITKRITEEKHKSTEIYEEERIEHIGGGDTIEKQINIKLRPNQTTSHNQANTVDHCVSSNNGHKHVLIVNTYKPKPTEVQARSQSPPKIRTYVTNSTTNDAITSTSTKTTESPATKYAIKHKANRYVSGAIGILETSLNGEYIILENLSSNKNVNLKGWYIHRYVPDQNINLIFKFVNETMLCCGEKLKILSRCSSTKVRSSSMYEGLNKSATSSSVAETFKPKEKFVSDGSEKILIAANIENWGTYSKFSVTKLINPDGVDKAVLTQSLLRLASSSSNVNIVSPRESSPNQHGKQANSSYYYNRAVSSNNVSKTRPVNELNVKPAAAAAAVHKSTLSSSASSSNYYNQYSPRSSSMQPASETITTTTTKKTETTSSSSHLTTISSSAPYIIENVAPPNVHVTRQF